MISIGSVRLENPFVLAPMAGVSDPPFRRLCRRGGAAMVCGEMVSSNALRHADATSRKMLEIFPDEHPISLQIFGSEPDLLAEASRMVADAGADIVDLNCGCPVPKIVRNGAGLALTVDETRFSRCVEAMVRAVKVPVTVKMRLGVKEENTSARLARVAEQSGATAIFLHARSKEGGHSGPPNLEALRETVESVRIPVFGNGGVSTSEQAAEMMATGCAGVMIGQAAMGNPLIFQRLLAQMTGVTAVDLGPKPGEKAPSDGVSRSHFDILKEHAQMTVEFFGESHGIPRLRKFFHAYTRGLPGACDLRRKMYTAETLAGLLEILETYQSGLDTNYPNL